MLNLTFRPRTTIIYHNHLASFTHHTNPRIFHRPFNELESKFIQEFGQSLNIGQVDFSNPFVEELKANGIIGEYSSGDEFEVLSFRQPQLLHMLTELTNRCNMNCDHCYTEANEHHHEEKELSGEEWIELFEKVRIKSRFITQNVSLTGGEPTVHPSFSQIIRYLSGKYKVEVSSNGLHFRKEDLEAIAECSSLNSLNISMDSVKKEEDEKIRGIDTFDRRIKNLRTISGYHIPVCIGIVVSNLNLSSLEETTAFYISKFPNVTIKYIPLTNIGRAMRLKLDKYLISGEEITRFKDITARMGERFGDKLLLDPSTRNNKFGKWSGRCSHMKYQFEPPEYKDSVLKPERCNAGYGVIDLSPSGRLRPCLRANSFFKETFSVLNKDTIMPKIGDKNVEEIGNLEFWKYVSSEVGGFNPGETCALKKIIKDEGHKYGL